MTTPLAPAARPASTRPSPARSTGTGSHEVLSMLRRHYLPEGRPEAGIFAPEIGSPDGRRRADLVWMPLGHAAGDAQIHGHEIKVSRADLLAELADATKADPWLRYCTRWWLVVDDPAMIAGLVIPEAWGVMASPSGRRTRSMTIVRPAPALKPIEQAPAFRRIACWHHALASTRVASAEHGKRWGEHRVQQLEQELQALRATGGGTLLREDERAALDAVAAARRHLSDGREWLIPEPAEIALAIRDLVAARAEVERRRMAAGDLERAIQRAVEAVDPHRAALSRRPARRAS